MTKTWLGLCSIGLSLHAFRQVSTRHLPVNHSELPTEDGVFAAVEQAICQCGKHARPPRSLSGNLVLMRVKCTPLVGGSGAVLWTTLRFSSAACAPRNHGARH